MRLNDLGDGPFVYFMVSIRHHAAGIGNDMAVELQLIGMNSIQAVESGFIPRTPTGSLVFES